MKPVMSEKMDASTATTAFSATASNKDAECYWGVSSHAENVCVVKTRVISEGLHMHLVGLELTACIDIRA